MMKTAAAVGRGTTGLSQSSQNPSKNNTLQFSNAGSLHAGSTAPRPRDVVAQAALRDETYLQYIQQRKSETVS